MSSSEKPSDRLDQILSELVDGDIDCDEIGGGSESGATSSALFAELAVLLRKNPDARREYIRWMSLHARLLSRNEAIPFTLPGEFTDSVPAHPAVATPIIPVAGSSPHAPPVASPVLGFLGGVVNYINQSRRLILALICGALVAYFAIQFGSRMFGLFKAPNAQVADNGAGAQRPAGVKDHPNAAPEKIIARLTDSVACKWGNPPISGADRGQPSKSDEMNLGAEFPAGRQLDLRAGLAELTFESGAKVTLIGPAEFTVTDPLGGHLHHGQAKVKVPHDSPQHATSVEDHGATGFTIDTPAGKVVDLGTEFGVQVDYDLTMQVIVYVGEVEVKSPSAPSGAGIVSPAPVRLKAGESVVVAPGQPVKWVAAQDNRDLGSLGDKPEAAETAYVELMKKLKPAVWFRMEGQDNERVLHDEMGGPDAKLMWEGSDAPFVKGLLGKSLWLRGENRKDYAILSDYPKAEHGKLTVSAWAYAVSRSNFASIVKNWWGRPGVGQFEFGLCPKNANGLGEGVDLSIRIADSSGQEILLREGLSHPFPENQWQHVAFVTDGSTLRLYRQGREVGSLTHNGLCFPVGIRALAIGAKAGESGKQSDLVWPAYWNGKLDEIALFNDALSADDIRRLAHSAPQ